jgi:hypothetical protein
MAKKLSMDAAIWRSKLGIPLYAEEKKYDVRVWGGGSVYMLRPQSDAAKAWFDAHLDVESWQMLGDAVAVEHRFYPAIVRGLINDGLSVMEV